MCILTLQNSLYYSFTSQIYQWAQLLTIYNSFAVLTNVLMQAQCVRIIILLIINYY